MVMEIPLTRGLVALVDDADYERVSAFNWYAYSGRGGKLVYAYKNPSRGRAAATGDRHWSMHRFILDAPLGQFVDHINHNTLDNRRENLRVCSCADNNRNRRKTMGASRFKGVTPRRGGFTATIGIRIGGKDRKIYLGDFATDEEAARAYDEAARLLHGEFALLNFPDNAEVA